MAVAVTAGVLSGHQPQVEHHPTRRRKPLHILQLGPRAADRLHPILGILLHSPRGVPAVPAGLAGRARRRPLDWTQKEGTGRRCRTLGVGGNGGETLLDDLPRSLVGYNGRAELSDTLRRLLYTSWSRRSEQCLSTIPGTLRAHSPGAGLIGRGRLADGPLGCVVYHSTSIRLFER